MPPTEADCCAPDVLQHSNLHHVLVDMRAFRDNPVCVIVVAVNIAPHIALYVEIDVHWVCDTLGSQCD